MVLVGDCLRRNAHCSVARSWEKCALLRGALPVVCLCLFARYSVLVPRGGLWADGH